MLIIAIGTPTLARSPLPRPAVCFEGVDLVLAAHLHQAIARHIVAVPYSVTRLPIRVIVRFRGKKETGSNGVFRCPRFCTLPRYLLLLLQDQVRGDRATRRTGGGASDRSTSVRIEVQYTVFF